MLLKSAMAIAVVAVVLPPALTYMYAVSNVTKYVQSLL